ncbi:MAG TPA: flagellar biosynthesis regulator FlaF [Roseomonas sp.]|nr:flagellar biosynthesis regulator FlaF [Roseomonas sp.]
MNPAAAPPSRPALAGQRAEEAVLFRRVVLLLRQAQEGADPATAIAAEEATRRLWEGVLCAVERPGTILPRALRQGLGALGGAVLREITQPAPDYAFLAAINEQVMAGLVTRH